MTRMASSLSSGRPNSLAGIGQKPNAGIAAGGEFYDCPRFCAMFDKPYIARYERKAGKLFQLVATFKDEATAGAGKGKPSSVVLRVDQIDPKSPKERCAWCGVKEVVLCGDCSSFICRAQITKRDGGFYFRCRSSCGGEGMITPNVMSFEGSKRLVPSSGSDRVGLPGKESLAALPPGRLKLKA